jgi:ubiquinone/menaquinone biosynthesis C-methylase UbiE
LKSSRTATPETEVARLYHRVAPRYGKVGPAVFPRLGRRLVEVTGVAAGEHVLDVGTGRGASLFPAAEIVGPGLVVGIDLAAAMLRETAGDLARLKLRNAVLLQMDARSLAFPDGVFDRLLCGFAVFLMPQPDVTFPEWHRVLRPGGSIGISIAGAGDTRWRWYEDLLLAYHETHRFPLSPGSAGPKNPEEVRAALARAGFADIRTVVEGHEFAYADAQEWWAAKWTHGARYPLEQMAPDVLAAFRADVFARLAALTGSEVLRESWQLVCVVASKPVGATA